MVGCTSAGSHLAEHGTAGVTSVSHPLGFHTRLVGRLLVHAGLPRYLMLSRGNFPLCQHANPWCHGASPHPQAGGRGEGLLLLGGYPAASCGKG